MREYTDVISVKIDNYIHGFRKSYHEDDCDIYFMEEGSASAYLDASCTLFMRLRTIDKKGILADARNLASNCTRHNMPFIILHNILENFQNSILCELLKEEHNPRVAYHFLKQMHMASDRICKYYLSRKIDKFLADNSRRIRTIEDLVDTTSLHFFEGHLVWLETLAHAIRNLDTEALPELNPAVCTLGQWLHQDGRQIIIDEQRWHHLDLLHRRLHLVAKRVEILMAATPIDYHYLLLLLDKADLLSLSIGIDLTLISNIEYIKHSSKDPLTGVLNRQLMDKIFKTQFELSKTLDTGFGLIMADIDNFKNVNDSHGHVFGDVVLKTFAEVLVNSTRKSDFVIRFGGEEFLLILPVTTLNESYEIAEKIRNAFAVKAIDKEGTPLYFSASFGVSYIHPEENEASSQRHMSELVDEVDHKLLLAKQSGKNRVVF